MQLFGLDWAVTSVQDLLNSKQEIIEKTNQNDLASLALLCLIYCLDFKEEEALKLLPKIVDKDQKKCLGQLLVNHFYCYVLVSEKFNIPKTKFKNLYQKALDYSGLVPDPSIGITIGASLIVKNEEKFLDNCLKSL